MVQQMIDKFNEYRPVNSGIAMSTVEKQLPVSVKKVALRDLPNGTRNIISTSPGDSPLIKDRSIADPGKLSGTKRPQPDCPLSPSRHQPSSNNGANGHFVYVRRKLETEPSKLNACGNVDRAVSPDSRKFSNDGTKETKVQQDQIQDPKISCFPVFTPVAVASLPTSSGGPSVPQSIRKHITGLVATEPHYSMVTTEIPVLVDRQKTSNQHWKERFLRLQMFLKHCDQSSQEEYIRMLRSLSAVGRSRHAVELEKRAIQLLLEEGKELQRMKVLNVLGKSSPQNYAPASMQTNSPVQAGPENQKTVDIDKLLSLSNG